MITDYGKVSIIVPVYNVELYFDECIKSLQKQTYNNIEIIIVDDGTEDNCGRKADEYAKEDNRIKSYHKTNGGLSSARNYGMQFATGDYLCFVDSDDFVSCDYIEKMVIAAEKYNADMVFSNFTAYYVNKDIPHGILLKLQEKEFDSEEYLECLYSYPGAYSEIWNKLFRKEIFQNLEFANMICEDAQIMLSIIDKCKKIYYIPDILYFYRRRKNSIANGRQEVILINEMKWIGDHKKRLKETQRLHLFSLAQKLCISKILEKYQFCGKDIRKKVKKYLNSEIKKFIKNPEIEKKKRIKYYVASKFPYIYGIYYSRKTRDKNIFWD